MLYRATNKELFTYQLFWYLVNINKICNDPVIYLNSNKQFCSQMLMIILPHTHSEHTQQGTDY